MKYGSWLVVFVIGIMMSAVAARAEQDTRTIDVSGTSEIQVQADYIEWEIELRDMHLDPVKAKAKNDARYKDLLKLVKDLDIERSDLIIGEVSIQKRHERNKDGDYLFVGYVVERQVVIIQRVLEDFDEMLTELAAYQAEFEISYGSTQLREMKRKAQLAAVEAARDKAKAIAGVLGQKVGRPLVIEDHDTIGGFNLNDALSNTSSGGSGDGRTRFGSITVRSGVDIRFELLDH